MCIYSYWPGMANENNTWYIPTSNYVLLILDFSIFQSSQPLLIPPWFKLPFSLPGFIASASPFPVHSESILCSNSYLSEEQIWLYSFLFLGGVQIFCFPVGWLLVWWLFKFQLIYVEQLWFPRVKFVPWVMVYLWKKI